MNHKPHSGSALILFTLMLPTLLIPLAGLGIDATMCYIVQAKLGSAVDGAALAAGRLLGTTANPAEIAGEFLAANFKTDGTTGFWGANTINKTVTYTPGITKTISVDANVRVPLLFARIFGGSYAVVSAVGTAQRTDSRVEVVIDRSGSMNTDDGTGTHTDVIDDVVNYAAGFTQRFTEGTDELGLVVFDGSGVVGYPTGTWSSVISGLSTGGPNTTFNDGTTNDMVHQINRINATSGTGMADALSIAYIELQKAHMRDVTTYGIDTRLNAIVLFTDGVPSGITLNLNNPANSYADAAIRSSGDCTNRRTSPPAMIGWFAIPGPPYSKTSFGANGMYQLASTDPNASHTSVWWMSDAGADAETPNPSTPFAGCTASGAAPAGQGLIGTSHSDFYMNGSGTDLGRIPNKDYYGNLLNTSGYTNSHITGGSSTSIYDGTGLDQTKYNLDYDWGLAMWNAVDNAAATIRSDANRSNRAGDTSTMSIQMFTIGYTGNGGCDDGLLKRVANDKLSSSYTASQPTGQYIQASDTNSLSNAFATIASEILRLAQ